MRSDGAEQSGQTAKPASARTVKPISPFKSVSLSTIRPRRIKDEIRQLEGMALILREKNRATRKHHRM